MEEAVIKGDPEIEIENIEYDSRLVKENALFVAIKGYQHDGYEFIPKALESGAVAVMGEKEECTLVDNYIQVPDIRKAMAEVSARIYGYPGLKLKACGVTGTNGKTTTCYLIKNILDARNKATGMITSQVYDTGKETFEAERTTPESLDLQRLLFLMKKNYCVNVVLEVSSHALMLHRVDNVDFRVAVFTNLTRDHLDFHETMEEYFNAKAKLMDRLEGPLSYAVINLDEPAFRPLFGNFISSYMSYSLSDAAADVYCTTYEINPDSTTFDIVTPMGNRTINLKLPGKFNLYNAIAAAAGGLASGVDLDSVVRGLEISEPVPGRFKYINQGQPFSVYVDYAHTPDAIERLINATKELIDGRILTLFGCGGDRDKGKREMMGTAATANSDYVVLTSDNPRSEDPLDIIEDVKPGLEGENYDICPDRAEAIRIIMKKAKPGDAVLLAGKGAETYQEIKGVREPFSDIEESIKVLNEMGFTLQEENQEN